MNHMKAVMIPRSSGDDTIAAYAARCDHVRRFFRGSVVVLDQPVTDARLGQEPTRLRRLWLELVAQLADVDAQVRDVVLVGRAPDLLQQLGMRAHLAGLLHQRREGPADQECCYYIFFY